MWSSGSRRRAGAGKRASTRRRKRALPAALGECGRLTPIATRLLALPGNRRKSSDLSVDPAFPAWRGRRLRRGRTQSRLSRIGTIRLTSAAPHLRPPARDLRRREDVRCAMGDVIVEIVDRLIAAEEKMLDSEDYDWPTSRAALENSSPTSRCDRSATRTSSGCAGSSRSAMRHGKPACEARTDSRCSAAVGACLRKSRPGGGTPVGEHGKPCWVRHLAGLALGHSKEAQIPAGPVRKIASPTGRTGVRAVGRRGTKFEAVPKLLNEKICCQGREHVLCMFSGCLSEGDRRLAGSVETVSPAVPRNRCAGRLARTSREEPVVDLLKRVASVARSAARERVTARRIGRKRRRPQPVIARTPGSPPGGTRRSESVLHPLGRFPAGPNPGDRDDEFSSRQGRHKSFFDLDRY